MNLRFLKSGWLILASLVLGGVCAVYFPSIGENYSFIGDIYLALLKMCAIPIVITTVVVSVATLFQSHELNRYLRRLLLLVVGGMVICGALGMMVGNLLGRSLAPDDKLLLRISSLLAEQDAKPLEVKSNFLLYVIPENIFQSLSEGKIISVLFFFLLFGVAVGKIQKELGVPILLNFKAISQALFKIVDWLTYFLPIGLFFISTQLFIPDILSLLSGLSGLMIASFGGIVVIAFAFILILYYFYPKNLSEILKSLRPACLVGISTTSSVAAMPFGLKALEDVFNLDPKTVELVFQIASTFNLTASTFYYSAITAFIAGIYHIPIGFPAYLALIGLVVLRGWATVGLPSIASINTFLALLTLFSIPSQAMSAILLASLPVIGPIITVVNILGNCALTTVLDRWVRPQI